METTKLKDILTESILENQGKYDSKQIRKMLSIVESGSDDLIVSLFEKQFMSEKVTRKSAFSAIFGVPARLILGAIGIAGGISMNRAVPGAAKAAAGNAAYGLAGYAVYRGIRAMFSKCTRQCGILGPNFKDRQRCMAACRIKQVEAKISLLKKAAAKTKDAGDRAAIQQGIQKGMTKLHELQAWESEAKSKGALDNSKSGKTKIW